MKKLEIQSIVLADDDKDDCDLFREALEEVTNKVELTFAKNGIQLLEMLNDPETSLPDLLFLDQNMPYKNGLECLEDMQNVNKFNPINTVIFSTSAQATYVNLAYELGANLYICKPSSFEKLKGVIAFCLSFGKHMPVLPREEFVISY